MIKTALKSLLIFSTLITGLVACGPVSSPDEVSVSFNVPDSMQRDDGLTECGRTWIPEGTTTQMMPNGSMNFNVPTGFSVINHHGFNAGKLSNNGTVTCTCTKGSGDCSPASDGSSVGCLIGPNCETCSRKASLSVIQRSVGIRFATQLEVETLPLGNSLMMDVPELAEEFRTFSKAHTLEAGDFQAPTLITDHSFIAEDDHVLVPVNAFGRILYTKMKRSSAKLFGQMGMVFAAKGTCSCTSGSSGCTYWSRFGYSGCEAGSCTSCSLTTSSVRMNQMELFER
ncbi:MAG: hypothetical protein HOI23_04285 [Deltaproteobacteria bacterium]|nr:hypothetical protein [Deltaproteobacteria bacterium]MBT6434286.1 hypothetical protein [Deltaproteobacteria bacterium]MBT6491867.1 hypothetical protein [Deltaproteobacteria bacterium]